jgi:hypothetical protein
MTETVRPKLIAFVSDVSARTQFILPNATHINSLPFDGIVVNIPASWSSMSPGVTVSEADVRQWLQPLTNFNVGKENYLAMEVDRPADLFDDAAWARVAQNWKTIGKVAAETGFKGILFDNEEYQGKWQDYPDNPTPQEAARGLSGYQAMASQRGREIMAALAETMPDAKVAVAHGPYTSAPRGPDVPAAISLQSGGPDGQELRGPFFTGFLEGLGPNQHLIDAGELYALRSAQEFQASFDYRNSTLPQRIDWQVRADALAQWSTRVDQGHIVYTDEFPVGYKQTPASLVTTLLNAFDHSEQAVFLYSESAQVPWLTPDVANKDWVAAASRAVELADNTQRGLAGNDSLVGSAKMDRLFGNAGFDTLRGNAGADIIYGGADGDTIHGDAGDDELYGEAGNDTIYSGAGADIMDGGAGSGDSVFYVNERAGAIINLANQSLNGGSAAGDRLVGIERIYGAVYADNNLTGDNASNILVGGIKTDILNGGGGFDILRGGLGADTLTGGTGGDYFQYTAAAEGGDTITAWESGDKFTFTRSAFGNLAGANVAAANFLSVATGHAASTTSHRFVFDQATDQLWYDADGSGAGAAIFIADITTNYNILNTDLLLA